jgi:hypothetical protein
LLYDSLATNNVVQKMYEHAKANVFSTCAQRYLDQWPTRHGQALLAAHRASAAKVTRVFLFKDWPEVSEFAASIMAKQAAQGITVYAFIDDESQFDWPQELTRDFTVVDDGAAIGVTTAFLLGPQSEQQTQAKWYFENAGRIGLFQDVIRTLVRESIDYDSFCARLAAAPQR